MRFFRFMLGLLLVPLCVAMTRTAWALVRTACPTPGVLPPPGALALAAGLLLWLAMFFLLPHPVRSYILAHELTHALWGSLMGAEVQDFQVRGGSGSVTLSKTNFLITLAPYFFPLYTVLAVAGYYALALFLPVERYSLWWLGLVGFTWGFHATFTVATLLQRQSDIQRCGRLFSYGFIYIMNVLGIGLWVVLISPATLGDFFGALRVETVAAARFTGMVGTWLAARVRGQ